MEHRPRSRPRLLALFRLAGLYGSERETREYLAQRIALYFRVLLLLYLLRYGSVVVLSAIQGGLWRELTSVSRLLHLLAILVATAGWLLVRQKALTIRQLAR